MGLYKFKKIEKDVYNTNEMIVSEFLFVGDDKYVVVDTGCDFKNYTKYLKEKLLDDKKDIMVVNTHFHPDHSNGNHRFDKVYIGAKDVPFTGYGLPYDRLVKNITTAVYKNMGLASIPLRLVVNKVFGTKKGKTEYIPLYDGDEIDLGDRKLVVRDLPGHTNGSIVLLDKDRQTIYTGDAVNMSTWMFTNPDMKLSEYAENLKSLYDDVKDEGYKKLRCSHVPIANKVTFIKDYAKFIESIKPGSELIKFNIPGVSSPLCIKVRPSLKHLMFGCFYFEDQVG